MSIHERPKRTYQPNNASKKADSKRSKYNIMQRKFTIPFLAVIVGVVLAVGSMAFAKSHTENTKKQLNKFNQEYVYQGDNSLAQQKDHTKYVRGTSTSCSGAQVVICTITTSTDQGPNPNFGAMDAHNPIDHPGDFVAITKKPS